MGFLMPVDPLSIAAELIAGEGLELVKDKAKRKEGVLRVLTKLGFKLDAPPANDFDGVYAYTLVVYGIDKPKPLIDFFRHSFIKSAFRQSFETRDSAYLEEENENFIDWNPTAKKLLSSYDYDPQREFAEFRKQFVVAAKLTRSVQQILVDQTLEDISEDIKELLSREDFNEEFESHVRESDTLSAERTRKSIHTIPFMTPLQKGSATLLKMVRI
jgi:hypothetical protein